MSKFLTNVSKKKRVAITIIALLVTSLMFVGCAKTEPAEAPAPDHKVEIQEIEANGLTFTVRTAGLENEGELVVFLHGFPESSIIWTSLMESLANQGYRVIAPNQRGYSAGARPEGVENYTYNHLTADVVALADAVDNPGKFHIVGHDWGGAVTWATYGFYPERIQSLTSLSTPHPKPYLWALENDPEQMEKSAYVTNFMIPGFEEYLAANDFAILRNTWKELPQEYIDDYLTIFSEPEARTATVNWYRTIQLPYGPDNPEVLTSDITAPSLFIWGNEDAYLARAGVDRTHPYIQAEYKFVILNAGHWLMENNTEEVSYEITQHILKHSEPKAE